MKDNEEKNFAEWFHAEYLKEFGPVDPKNKEARQHHRNLRNWCEMAWLMGRSSTYSGEGV